MNGKERVSAAIERKELDCLPLGLYAVDKDIVSKVIGRHTYFRNRIDFQLAIWEGRRNEAVEGWKKDLVEFYKKIDCVDIITFRDAQLVPPKNYNCELPKKISDDKWQDSNGRVYKAVYEHDEMVCIYDPNVSYKEPEDYTTDDFKELTDIKPPDSTMFEIIDYLIDELGSERYIAGPSGGFTPMVRIGPNYSVEGPSGVFLHGFRSGVATSQWPSDMEFGMMMYALDPEVVQAANMQAAQIQDKMDEYFIRKDYDGLVMDQDMGGTNALLISPLIFSKCCFPFMKQRVFHAKECHKNVKKDNEFEPQVIMHNCGNTIALMQSFIDSGIDCYQSLQTTAGMDMSKLKTMFGSKMSFWGGISVEKLIEGTREDIKNEVRNALRFAGSTGSIIGPSQSIAMGTKYDNFMTMIDTFVNERTSFI